MATPHCAIAQDGSNAATSLKACRACSYWKECNRATARLKPGCAAFEHEVKKWTEPISPAESSWWCSCAASPGATIKKNGISKIVVRRMAFRLQEWAHGKMERGVFEKVCRCRSAKSTRKIVVEAGFEGEVRTKLMNLDISQELWREFGREGKRDAIVTGDFGSVEKEKFADDSRRESSPVERWSRFEENA